MVFVHSIGVWPWTIFPPIKAYVRYLFQTWSNIIVEGLFFEVRE